VAFFPLEARSRPAVDPKHEARQNGLKNSNLSQVILADATRLEDTMALL
jgi:hypothetical protein